MFQNPDNETERSAHCGKNFGIDILGNVMFLPIQDIFAHSGWIVKNFNTFFDYWTGTMKSLKRSGKALGGWNVTGGGNVVSGGISPTLDAIKNCNRDSLMKFRDTLLGIDILLDSVKNLLLANGLRFLNGAYL